MDAVVLLAVAAGLMVWAGARWWRERQAQKRAMLARRLRRARELQAAIVQAAQQRAYDTAGSEAWVDAGPFADTYPMEEARP